ncbi:ADP-ribosylation factor-binding protein GGA1 [Teleopsis dalmanni]|uniref:ADP-ribosylation factor-binding protein GGA1 n=1 Tax=Teleopsis dalmanni TaxID=139649 RepID=UPI0018CDB510|nr:ADP-ribosylation factor-binding protein GGA1 [Teleopsis dalmanni]
MTTDENLLDIMLVRATNPEQEPVDELSVQMFCMVLRSNSQLIQKAHELLMSKVRSSNVMEATRAIELLEECMAKCGDEFQHETSKNVFLNNLIRLVSPKYEGAETPTEIKQRIMKCLMLWTTEYPSRQKIGAVYEMLSKEYVAEPEKTTTILNRKDNLLGIDEEKLVNLIRSKDPKNYERANLLIQCRVSQETRRKNLIMQQKNQIQEVDNLVELLSQLLDNYENEKSKNNHQDADTLILLKELYLDCKKHKPIMRQLPEIIEKTEEDLIAEALQTNDLLIAVMKRYKNIVKYQPTETVESNSNGVAASSLTNSSHTDLLADLLGDKSNDIEILTAKKVETVSAEQMKVTTSAVFDDWAKLFDDKKPTESAKNYEDLFSSLELLEPVKVEENIADKKMEQKLSKPALRELREIDKISEDLFKENLSTDKRIGSFKKEPEKITLNDLVKEKTIIPNAANNSPNDNREIKENISVISPSKESVNQLDVEEIINTESEKQENNTENINKEENEEVSKHIENVNKLIYLSEINIELDDVLLSFKDHILTVTDDNIIITLLFTKNRPSKNVGVIVVSVTNLGKMDVKDFQFEASVKKPCKVRLLEPTRCDMPPCSHTSAPTSIKQVMLLLNPTGSPVDVTCIFGYKLNEDPDPVKESIVAKDIVLFE